MFIQPRGRWSFSTCPEPPLGLAYLASSLLEYNADLQIEIMDGFTVAYEDYINKISNTKADIVGVTTTMSHLNEALRIPSLIKNKQVKLIIGGPGVTNLDSLRIFQSGYSIICFGEGEKTIVELTKVFENKMALADVNGISYLLNGMEIKTKTRELIENLDDIPLPARELLNMEKYIGTWKEKMGVALSQIVSSRGCPFSCRFCDHNRFGKKFRFMSVPRVIEEMRQLYEKYKAEMIFFEEDLFVLNKKRVLGLCEAIKKEFPDKKWGANARVDSIDSEMLSKMKNAGCTDLNFGIESGSQKILDFLGKGITIEAIKKAFKMLNEVRINGGMFLLIGVPGTTQKDIDLTKELIDECKPYMINLWYLTPFPGTEIFETTKNLIRDDIDFYNWNDSYESVYRKDIFEVQPREEFHQIMNFFLEKFEGKVDPKLSIYDGTMIIDKEDLSRM